MNAVIETYKVEPARLAAAPLEVYEYFYFQYGPEIAYEYWKNHVNPPQGNRKACLASPRKKRRKTTGKTELLILKTLRKIGKPCFPMDVQKTLPEIKIENVRTRLGMVYEKGFADRTATNKRRQPFSYTITDAGIKAIEQLEREVAA